MTPVYSKSFLAGWGDMDFNAHMRNTAYLDRAVDVRMMFFAEHGFPMSEFARLRIGPVVMKDELEYHREIGLLEAFTVSLELAGLAPDGSRVLLRNLTLRADGRTSAQVTSLCCWLDLPARKRIVPPAALRAAMDSLPRTEDFVELAPIRPAGG